MALLERLRGLSLLILLTVCWGIVMLQFGDREIYSIVGSYALFASLVVLAVYRDQARAWFRCGLRELAVGIGLGAVMMAATYPIYRLAVVLEPALEPVVAELYRTSHKGHLGAALCWVLVILTAEELLFRGAFPSALERYLGQNKALALSVALYAGAQACSGSLIVALLALCCGTVWALERALTGSLVAPLLSHMIWTPVVILLRPVVD